MILFFSSFSVYSQLYQIDSVVVAHCKSNPGYDEISIDSIDLNGLLINRTSYDELGMPINQTLNSYSATHKLLRWAYNSIQNSSWVINQEEIHQYDILDSLIQITVLYYTNGSVVNGNQNIYTYDSLNRIKVGISQKYVDSTSSWITNSRNTIYFDSTGKIIHSIGELWTPPNTYILKYEFLHYYFPNGLIDDIIFVNHSTPDSTRYDYIYDTVNFVTHILEQKWEGSTWAAPEDSTTYYFDTNNNLIGVNYYTWFMREWNLCNTSINVFDLENRLIHYSSNAVGLCGRGGRSGSTFYNVNGSIDSMFYCRWTMGTQNCYKCWYEYFNLPLTTGNQIERFFCELFPNPAKDEITLLIPNYFSQTEINFTDITGRIIKRERLYSEKTIFSISEFPSGIYFITFPEIELRPIRFIKN